MLQAILFDLDGTLLPMDTDAFTKAYFGNLAIKAREWGYTDAEALIAGIWGGTYAMIKNDSDQNNETVFWAEFGRIMNRDAGADIPKFDSFYENEFHAAKAATKEAPLAVEAVRLAREKAERVILATNPIFPRVATQARLSWIGLKDTDFDLVTDYTNSRRAKPNPDYYREILAQFDLDPARCLMIGNDVTEDMVAAQSVGIPTYLITDCLLNKKQLPITCPHGTYADMVTMLREL